MGFAIAVNDQSGASFNPNLSPSRAVLLGHLVVSLPVIAIIGIVFLTSYALKGPAWGVAGLLLGVLPAWLWWSLTIPLWRDWAKRQGADEARTQYLGQWTGLVWPKGSFFEKTEIKLRKKT